MFIKTMPDMHLPPAFNNLKYKNRRLGRIKLFSLDSYANELKTFAARASY